MLSDYLIVHFGRRQRLHFLQFISYDLSLILIRQNLADLKLKLFHQ